MCTAKFPLLRLFGRQLHTLATSTFVFDDSHTLWSLPGAPFPMTVAHCGNFHLPLDDSTSPHVRALDMYNLCTGLTKHNSKSHFTSRFSTRHARSPLRPDKIRTSPSEGSPRTIQLRISPDVSKTRHARSPPTTIRNRTAVWRIRPARSPQRFAFCEFCRCLHLSLNTCISTPVSQHRCFPFIHALDDDNGSG